MLDQHAGRFSFGLDSTRGLPCGGRWLARMPGDFRLSAKLSLTSDDIAAVRKELVQ
ncbi:hypothetical protein ACVDG5_024215 [Mesorhizobium sp. ORM6]